MTAGDWQRRLQDWQDSGAFSELLPEVAALEGVAQSAEFHAEGNALVHTFMAVSSVDGRADERVFWAVLLHDIGKGQTSEYIDGDWRSHGHVSCGALMVPAILKRLNLDPISNDVVWLVKHHHFVFDWGEYVDTGLTGRQKRFCHLPLFPLLVEVCRADAAASLGSSRKGELLNLVLAQQAIFSGETND